MARFRLHRALAALCLVLTAMAVAAAWLLGTRGLDRAQRIPVAVTKVVDGDTIRCRAAGRLARQPELKVRLCGINAAELGTAESFRAALAFAELVEGADACWLEPERKSDNSLRHDKHGRLLGWLWVKPASSWATQRIELAVAKPSPLRQNGGGQVLVQEELLGLGLVELYGDPPTTRYYQRLANVRSPAPP